jgi:outer membrane protein insertion porin family
VDIHIQIEETPLYRIGEIVVEGNKVLSTEQILSKVRLKPGDPCRDITLMEDLREIRNLYAERSYILATVDSRWEAMAEPHTMRLRLRIEERDPAVVGFVEFRAVRRRDDGTVEPVLQRRTRDDVLRRELRSFAPGEPFDGTALDRGIQRLRDTGWFEPDISYDITPGRIEGTRDVTIYVQERQTGTFRLLGGYSSAFGIVGVLEFTQQNFDIARLPRSLDELVRGEAFVGGGQYFNIRFMPGQRREQFSVAFREPYIFGLDYGGGFSFFRTLTNRESWDESTLGGGVFLDRRWGDLRVALNAQAESLDIENVDADAPAIVRRLEGNNTTIQIGPSVRYDARDSVQLATEGFLVEGQLWLSSQAIGSDFNFWKARIEYEHLFPVYEPEERNRMRRHVLSVRGTLGLADTFAGDDSVPFFERFFAGGRGSMRGFAFRGMGPHEGDDPTGGQMLVLGSIEYSLPLYEDFLRLAVFTDVGNLAGKIRELGEDKWRVTVGVGLRALVPFLSQTPVALDFGFALVREDFDDEQIITFDIGRLF